MRDIWLPTWIIRIVSNALFFSLVGQLLGSRERLEFLVIGNVVAASALATAIAVAISTWDRFDGTYPLLVIAPTTLVIPTIGRTACRLITGVGASLLAFVVLAALFQLPFPWPIGLLVIPLLVLTAASSYCLMLFLGAVANYAPTARNLIHNLATMCMMGFCGVNVPITFWPAWVQGAAQLLPLTHGLAAIRATLDGSSMMVIGGDALLEFAVGAGWFALAAVTMDRMASAGRATGSIELIR